MSYTFTPEECTGENTLNVRLGEEVLLRLTAKKGETELRMKPYDKVVPGLEELVAVRKKFRNSEEPTEMRQGLPVTTTAEKDTEKEQINS